MILKQEKSIVLTDRLLPTEDRTLDTGFDKELERDLENSGWLEDEPVLNSYDGSEKKQDIDELFSKIVAQAEASYISSKEAVAKQNSLNDPKDDRQEKSESENEPEIQVNKRRNKRLGDIADKIKNAEVLQPDVLKDMFFGSRDTSSLADPSDTEYDEDEEDQTTLFTKRRPYTADVKKDKLIFEAEYMLVPDQAAEGYMLFYNEFVKKKNVKITLMFGAVIILLLICALIFPDSFIFYPLIFLCAAIAGIKWLGSMSARKDALASAEGVKNDSYRLSFYNSRIIIKASRLDGDTFYSYPPVMIRFEDIDLKVIDYDTIYVLVFKKDYVYTIPKSSLTDEMNKVFTNHLISILGDDYFEFFTRARNDRFRLKKQEDHGKAESSGKTEKEKEIEIDKDKDRKREDAPTEKE